MHVYVTSNSYADALGKGLFDETPKAVFAAIAVSALTLGGEGLAQAAELIVREWTILHENGIVPQKPGPRVRAFAEKRL